MTKKRALYVAEGAEEVWLVGEDETVLFFEAAGPMDAPRLAPDFPEEV